MPTIAAPDIASLLAYEQHIEAAWCALIKNATGVSAAPAFHVELDDKNQIVPKSTPFVDVILTQVQPTGHKVILADRTEMYDAWQGTLATKLVTTRDVDSKRQDSILGGIRSVAREPLFPAQLAWHFVRTIRESGMQRGIDTVNRLDWTELTFVVNFNVLAAAWPTDSLFAPQ